MELIEGIKTRRSIRRFTEEPVANEVIERIVEAAAYAPSWKNTQISRYYVVTDPEKKAQIANEAVLGFEPNTKTINSATALVVMTMVLKRSGYERDGSYTTSKEDRWQNFDAGIAAQTFSLAAHAEGLGTVMLGIFDDAKVAEILNIPEEQQVSVLLAMGHPAIEAEAPARKSVEQLLQII